MQGRGSYNDGKTYGDLSVDGNLVLKGGTYSHYGNILSTKKTSLNGDTTKFYGNVDTKDFYFERVVELQGYLHTTGNDVNLGKCNPYSGHCQTIYFTGDETYNGYTIYCEGNATYAFNTEKITLNTNNGRNILKKDMYVGGDLNVTWFGHTELGFSGKVVVDGNVKINNYQAKKSTNHPNVTDPKNITFANLTCANQSLQLTENYHNADVENVVSVYDSGSAVIITPYACLGNVVVVKIDDEIIFTGKKGDNFTLPETQQNIIGYSDGETLYQPNDEITVDKNIEFTTILRSIEESDFAIDLSDKVYTSDEIAVEISSATGLVEGIDYRVYYENNTNVGVATVTIAGLGHYVGSIEKTFNIVKKTLLTSEFSLEGNSFVYTGEEIKPNVLSDVPNENFDVEYTENLNVGEATVTVIGKNNCQGTVELKFEISQKEISAENFTVDTENKVYTGSEILTDIVSNLTNKDYEVSYENNINVGVATVIVKGVGNYKGMLTYNFNITQKSIAEDDFTVDTESKVYTSEKITTDITSKLVLGKDYEVEYANNVNVGVATVTITGIGNYAGELVYNFEITQKDITSDDFVIDVSDKVFTGNEIATDIDSELLKDKDYEVVYENNINVGIVTVIINGTGNYKGKVETTFKIVQKEIIAEDFSLKNESELYTGEEIKPAVLSDIDAENFDVVYSNNINEGIATITITGKNNCKGEVVLTFRIIKEFTKDAFSLDGDAFVYTSEAITPSVISEYDAENYEVSYENNVNVGTAIVTITATGENYIGEVKLTFEITPKEVEKDYFTVDTTEKVYTGSEIIPAAESELIKDVDYTVEYSNNVNVGEGKIIVTGKGNYKDTVEYIFDITPKPLDAENFIFDTKNVVYTGFEIKPQVMGTLSTDCYEISYENNVNVGEGKIIVTGKGNYKDVVTATFNIVSKYITEDMFTFDLDKKRIYSGEAFEDAVISELIKDVDYTVEYENNVNVGEATVIITGIGNYAGTIVKTFAISQKAIDQTMFKIDKTLREYTGKAHTPELESNLSKGVDYVLAYTNNKNVGKATITVIGIGNYQGKLNYTFTIKKPTVKKVKGVKATSTKAKTLTVKWKKVKGVKGYVIQYSLKKNFKGKKVITVTKQKTVKKLIKKLKSGKKYYVRVAAYKNYKNAKGKTLKAIGQFAKVKYAVKVK